MRIRKQHPYPWLVEGIEDLPGFEEKSMFGCKADYIDERMVLVMASGEEPWNGIMVPAGRENHAVILRDFPMLQPHPVLGKWLYLSQTDAGFEEVAARIVARIRKRDPLIGVIPPKKTKKKKKRAASPHKPGATLRPAAPKEVKKKSRRS